MSADVPRHLYHYTEAAHAEAIAEDGVYLVGGGTRFGPGLYATDLEPAEASDEEIREICFEGDGADPAYSGFLRLLKVERFERSSLGSSSCRPRAWEKRSGSTPSWSGSAGGRRAGNGRSILGHHEPDLHPDVRLLHRCGTVVW